MYHEAKTINAGTTDLVRFESTHELAADLLSRAGEFKQYNKYLTPVHPETSASWIGRPFADLTDAIHKSEKTWDEGLRVMDKMIAEFADAHLPSPKSVRRRGRWSEDGGEEINVDRYLRSQPYWRTTTKKQKAGPKTITLIVNVSTHSGVKSNKILWRGAAAICLTHLLEQAGYRVTIIAVNWVWGYWNNRSLLSMVTIKDAFAPLNVSQLINCVSGWFFRTSILAIQNLIGGSAISSSYGSPQHFNEDHSIVAEITPDSQALVFDNVWDYDSAIRLVRKQLERFTA